MQKSDPYQKPRGALQAPLLAQLLAKAITAKAAVPLIQRAASPEPLKSETLCQTLAGQITEILQKSGTLSPMELTQLLPVSRSTVIRAVRTMVIEGSVKAVGTTRNRRLSSTKKEVVS